MDLDLTPDELLTTTRAVRRRLDFERPVERGVILDCLRLAIQAPTGSNRQGWHWVVVTDAKKRRGLAELYRPALAGVYTPAEEAGMDPQMKRVWASAAYLAEHFHEVPVLLVPCVWGRPPTREADQAGFWGSILPAVWSFMLAARNRGLGTAWTTIHLQHEQQAAELLGIPFERCSQAGLIPVAYTKGTDFKPATRRPVEDVVHWDEW